MVDAFSDDLASVLSSSMHAPNSPLSITLSAVSLAVFGKTKGSETAISTSTEKYTQALGLAKQSFSNESQATSDEMLLTVMMLLQYEVWPYVLYPPD